MELRLGLDIRYFIQIIYVDTWNILAIKFPKADSSIRYLIL